MKKEKREGAKRTGIGILKTKKMWPLISKSRDKREDLIVKIKRIREKGEIRRNIKGRTIGPDKVGKFAI